MYVGKNIKQIRLNKNIKAKDVYTGIMSRSSYEKFENGISDTSSVNFINILSKLNLTYAELISLSPNASGPFLINRIHRLFRNRKTTTKLIDISNLKIDKYVLYENNSCDTIIISLYGKCLYYILKGDLKHACAYSSPIKEILSKIESWSSTEYIIFSDVAICYNSDTLFTLSNELFRSFNQTQSADSFSEILFSTISVLLYRDKLTLAKKLLTHLETVITQQASNTSLKIRFTILNNIFLNSKNANIHIIPEKSMADLYLFDEINTYQIIIPNFIAKNYFSYL